MYLEKVVPVACREFSPLHAEYYRYRTGVLVPAVGYRLRPLLNDASTIPYRTDCTSTGHSLARAYGTDRPEQNGQNRLNGRVHARRRVVAATYSRLECIDYRYVTTYR